MWDDWCDVYHPSSVKIYVIRYRINASYKMKSDEYFVLIFQKDDRICHLFKAMWSIFKMDYIRVHILLQKQKQNYFSRVIFFTL